jgi:hypothetical protein
VWKLPSLSELAEGRKEISVDDWAGQEYLDVIGKCRTECLPVHDGNFFSQALQKGLGRLGMCLSTCPSRIVNYQVIERISSNICTIPNMTLYTGHRSIVNNTLFHPHFLHVLTCGVERDILLHSPTQSSPCSQNLSLTTPEVRNLTNGDSDEDQSRFLTALSGQHLTIYEDREDAQAHTIEMFDW